MDFVLDIPRTSEEPLKLTISTGEKIFVLGPNGTGKTRLLRQFFDWHRNHSLRIAAHRRTWLESSGVQLASADRNRLTLEFMDWDSREMSGWRDQGSGSRVNAILYDFVEAENASAREIAAAVRCSDIGLAQSLARKDPPLTVLNDLMRLSNLNIEVFVREDQSIEASRAGGPPYSIERLSDGERNALLMAIEILTARPETLFIIDEPERHLHRSIISPLLTHLFARRNDCAFVVATHDVTLPLDNRAARVLLLRDVDFSEGRVAWDADMVPEKAAIGEDIKRDILGARRTMIFVEGTQDSLDEPLYSLIFAGISIVPKSGSSEVIRAVSGLREAADFHWLGVYGVVDNDGRPIADIERLKANGVYALACYSVESVYYHPEIQRRVAERQAELLGGDAKARLALAARSAIRAVADNGEHMAQRAVEKSLRERVFQAAPTMKTIAAGAAINLTIDVEGEVKAEMNHLDELLGAGDLEAVINRYPVRESQAFGAIARALGFQSRQQYEGAVLKSLIDDADALAFARSLFGTLAADIEAGD